MTDPTPICLECAYGKHRNCDGTALHEDTDQIGPCDCAACAPVQPEPTARRCDAEADQ